jgi:hypothetical protein
VRYIAACSASRFQRSQSGSPDHIGGSVYRLYRNWLPHSGEELRDFPAWGSRGRSVEFKCMVAGLTNQLILSHIL